MRVNVCFGERSVTYDVPDGVWFVGLTVHYNDMNWTEMNLLAKSDEQTDVELINEDGFRVIVHCYTCPGLAEVADILNEFKGLSLYECRCEKISLLVVL